MGFVRTFLRSESAFILPKVLIQGQMLAIQ